VLDLLICNAFQQNLTVREAGFRVLQSRAKLGIAIGELFPQTQIANGGFTQEGVSVGVANRNAAPQRYFSQWDFGFRLAWELDVWGKFRRMIESADDQLNASIEDYDWVVVTLLGDVATAYVQMRTIAQQIVYTQTNVELQRETLAIARARFLG